MSLFIASFLLATFEDVRTTFTCFLAMYTPVCATFGLVLATFQFGAMFWGGRATFTCFLAMFTPVCATFQFGAMFGGGRTTFTCFLAMFTPVCAPFGLILETFMLVLATLHSRSLFFSLSPQKNPLARGQEDSS